MGWISNIASITFLFPRKIPREYIFSLGERRKESAIDIYVQGCNKFVDTRKTMIEQQFSLTLMLRLTFISTRVPDCQYVKRTVGVQNRCRLAAYSEQLK